MMRDQELLDFYRQRLLQDTVPFWLRHAIDLECGGFITSLDQDGCVIDTDKGVWQQGRGTWLFGELYNQVDNSQAWLQAAEHGIRFLDQFCFDPADGRMWFHLDRQGNPIRKRRYAFSEAFAAIAYGEWAKATGNACYAMKAANVFEQFLALNKQLPVLEPKFTPHRQTRSLAVPMITINTAQELRDSVQLPAAEKIIDEAIEQIREFHLRPTEECVLETVGQHGDYLPHFDGRTLNPGHAIEGAWFIMWEGMYRQDVELTKLGCQILDWMWVRGWDQKYGGLLYFTSVDGRPIQEYWHDMKFWWPQNEGLIATLLAYLLTGEARYAKWHDELHRWAHQYFPDPKYGEWFGYLHRDGSLSSTLKGNLWKGPFHLPRQQ
ncbi:MAG: AGE family epimerase/isomerase, partial [Planctomycetales bacterium]|nr:AGE family epimerase/isomerase [Planctomycetales bacterium]